MFSCGFSSGLYGGRINVLTLSGSVSLPPGLCHPAPSTMTTAWAPGVTASPIVARCRVMASLSA